MNKTQAPEAVQTLFEQTDKNQPRPCPSCQQPNPTIRISCDPDKLHHQDRNVYYTGPRYLTLNCTCGLCLVATRQTDGTVEITSLTRPKPAPTSNP